MADNAAPSFLSRPQGADAGLMVVALLAVSTSGPIMKGIAIPTLAIAFWRNALASGVLLPVAFLRRSTRAELRGTSTTERRLCSWSGVMLAVHFGTWIPALAFTSVASATAITATQPIWAALIARMQGQRIHRSTWFGMGLALVGVVLLSGADFSVEPRALFGDALALVGGVSAAAYMTLGGMARRTMSTTSYTTFCYAVTAILLLPICLVTSSDLSGYDAGAWFGLLAVTALAQFLGHSLFNRILRSVDPTFVSLVVLLEVPGAAILAAIFLDQTPSWRALPAAVLLLAGVVTVVRSGARVPPVVD